MFGYQQTESSFLSFSIALFDSQYILLIVGWLQIVSICVYLFSIVQNPFSLLIATYLFCYLLIHAHYLAVSLIGTTQIHLNLF